MSMPSLRALLLEVLEEAGPNAPLSFDEIVNRLHAKGLPPKGKNPVLGRLSILRNEGVVKKAERGLYTLARIDHSPSPLENKVLDVARTVFKPKALQSAVVWDATPYLELTEDGAPGQRLVFEHPAADLLKDAIESKWSAPAPFVWVTRSKGPLGTLLWHPDDNAPSRIETGILLVAKERIGGTGVTPHGYRAPFPERIMLEFLGLEIDADVASPILRQMLRRGIDISRAWTSANALGNLADLTALLAAAYPSLPPHTQQEVRGRIAPAVGALLEKT